MILNKYIAFDISIHSTLSKFNRQSLMFRPSLNKLLTILSNNWINIGYASLDENEKYKTLANIILTNYYNHPLDINNDCFIIDKFISTVNVNGKVISCRVDKMVELYDGNIEFIDYKSGANIPLCSTPFYDYKLYKNLYILNKELGIIPDYFSYYYLRYNKKLTLKIDNKILSTLGNYYHLK